jgi:chromosome segregation ATPase
MENQTNIEKLNAKVTEILQHYNSLKSENESMRNELVSLKAEKELKDQEIQKLIEQNAQKDIEIDEIANKIESILG